MEDDARLKEIFNGYNPRLKGDKEFIDSLQKRMRVVEIVQQSQKTDTRLSRLMLVVTFALGALSAVLVMLLCGDADAVMPPLEMFGANLFLLLNMRVIMFTVVAMMMSACVIFIVGGLYRYLRRRNNRLKMAMLKDI